MIEMFIESLAQVLEEHRDEKGHFECTFKETRGLVHQALGRCLAINENYIAKFVIDKMTEKTK